LNENKKHLRVRREGGLGGREREGKGEGKEGGL